MSRISVHKPGVRKGADFLYHVDPKQLKANGVELVGFYLKRATKEQIDAYHKAGISVFLIHQRGYEGRLPDSAEWGRRHGEEANTQAAALGYPIELPIVFASMGDYDNGPDNVRRSAAYFAAARKACKWPAGAYGDWDLFDAIGPTALSVQAAAKAWSYDWIRRKWKGPHPTAHIVQRPSVRAYTPVLPDWPGAYVDPLDIVRAVSAWGPPSKTVPPYNPPTSWGVYPTIVKPVIQRNDKRAVVGYLQNVIKYKAGGGIRVTEQFGPQTESRVKDLQRLFGLPPTGIVDSATWKAVDFLAVGKA